MEDESTPAVSSTSPVKPAPEKPVAKPSEPLIASVDAVDSMCAVGAHHAEDASCRAAELDEEQETGDEKEEQEEREDVCQSLSPICLSQFGQLGPQVGPNVGRKTLVLDLDETLVHSSFRATTRSDIIITVELEGELHNVYVRKRPGVDEFLQSVTQLYEVVIYTASMSKYADPLIDELDPANTILHRLFREACTRCASGYVKDLSKLGRDLKDVIIIDNSPLCYALQPENAIPIKTWRDDVSDQELIDLIPILYALATVDNIPVVLKHIMSSADEG